jgi:hypothetical protein
MAGWNTWVAWSLVVGCAMMSLLWAAQDFQVQRRTGLRLENEIAQAKTIEPAMVASSPPADFTAQMGRSPSAARQLNGLQRACSTAGVVLLSTTISEHLASESELGRIEINASLRGSYEGTKRVLREVLMRDAATTVKSLRMRQDTGKTGLETQLVLNYWYQPASGSGSTAGLSSTSR